MIPYLCMAFTPVIAQIIYPRTDVDQKQKKKFLILCGLVLIFFMGCRSMYLGSEDTYRYCMGLSEAAKSSSWQAFYIREREEIGYQVFVWLLSRVFKQPQWLLFLTSFFFVFTILRFIYKYSQNVTLSVLLYISVALMLFNMQGLRQSIAMCICIYSVDFAKRRRIVPFLLLCALATTFHRTAIVFIIVYFLCNQNVTSAKVLLTIMVAIILLAASNYITQIANLFFTTNTAIQRTYTKVADSGGYIVLTIHLLTLMLALMMDSDIFDEDNFESALFYLATIGTVCYIMRYFGTREAERISFYFAFAEVALLPNALEHFKGKDKLVIDLLAGALAIGLFVYKLSGSDFVPYDFFWNV